MNTYSKDGQGRHFYNDHPAYAPNSMNGPAADAERAAPSAGWEADGEMVRTAYTLRADDDDFGQAGTLVREVFDDAQRDRLVETLTGQYNALTREEVKERFLWYWGEVDATTAERIKQNVGLSVVQNVAG